ncbi:PH domain-containing protein [Candidatus Saccharibacteria bacterium]|nr:PH domain-containing protein [Candidatus Saccharibacteria bacterium]
MAEDTKKQPPAAPPPFEGVSNRPEQDLLEPGEEILTVVNQSIIGLIGIYLIAFVTVAALTTLVVVLSPDTFKISSDNISGALSLIMLLSAILLTLILFTATYIYRQNRLLVTNRSLVQILQKSLFNRKVSRLSMSNVEDVNEEQRGIIAMIFNYGTLNVQTAGAQDNFTFNLCPNPAALADRIIEARQAYAKNLEEGKAS